MAAPLPPAARERRLAARRVLERALLGILLWRLGGALGRALASPETVPGPLPALRVDLATDPAWRLRHLPGVGPTRAEALVADRREHGPPTALEDLTRVRGFGPGRLEALRRASGVRLLVNGAPPSPPPPAASR